MTLPELAANMRAFIQDEEPNPRLTALTQEDFEQILQMAEICQGRQEIVITSDRARGSK